MDHVANPTGGPTSFAVVTGTCPSTHPVKIPQVHLEVGTTAQQLLFITTHLAPVDRSCGTRQPSTIRQNGPRTAASPSSSAPEIGIVNPPCAYLGTGTDESSTGYGQHADYVFGWKDDTLQKAMDNACFGAACGSLTTQADSVSGACAVKNTVAETTEGCKCHRLFEVSTPAKC